MPCLVQVSGLSSLLNLVGRAYPGWQELLLPFFMQSYNDPQEKVAVKWAILIGIGRMAQSNPKLLESFYKEWILGCFSPNVRIRWGGRCHQIYLVTMR